MEEKDKNKDWLLPASIIIAAVLIAGSVIYSSGLKNTPQLGDDKAKSDAAGQISPELQIGDDVVLGDSRAPATIFIFGDYQCPYCAQFFKETELLVRKNYVETGKAKLIFKDLAFLGPESTAAAEAAECARDQEKYWQYHDSLYETEYVEVEKVLNGEIATNEGNGNLNRDLFKKIASDQKMNVDEFLSCFDSRKYKGEVEGDINEAKDAMTAAGQRVSTPTSFINGKIIQGLYSYDAFAQAIDEALNKR